MWYRAEYSVMPNQIDDTSSSVYVYVRKNIERTEKGEEGKKQIVYTCDEQKILKSDWSLYQTILTHDSELTEVQDALIELAEIIGG